MEQTLNDDTGTDDWSWFEAGSTALSAPETDALARSFARCLCGGEGAVVIKHLRQTILERRLGPTASDAELRFLEGQRSVVAHILSMIDRGTS